MAQVLKRGIREAAAAGRRSSARPIECVSSYGGSDARAALEAIGRTALEGKIYVAANLKEKVDGSAYCTSYLIGPDGSVAGKYRKPHRLPDEDIALAADLPVFETPTAAGP